MKSQNYIIIKMGKFKV